jgi:hypothetical protein
MTKIIFRLKGGVGSGFRGHRGIPGHQGGSQAEGATGNTDEEKRASQYDIDMRKAKRITEGMRNNQFVEHMQEQDKKKIPEKKAEMPPKKIIAKVKASLNNLAQNVNTWSARDTIMTLANEYLGTDYVSLGGEEGVKTAAKLARQLRNLPDDMLLEIEDKGHLR